jgi:crotonobetainyl-CoA:carnitine CoA-transferase CaiB-like acyl-CoA transferase
MAPYEAFKTCRGYVIIAAGNERLWRKLCTVLGRPDLASDARFATNAERWENSAQLSAEITAVLSTRDALEWAELLRDAGIPGGVINSVSQALDDEQVQALGLLADAPELPEAKYAFVHTPLLTGGQRFPIRSLAPELNAHAAELLAELGLDDLEPTSADAHPARSGEGKDD